MTIKTYVLDTNILLDDPSAVASFDDNEVIIPLIVLEEIDRFKDKPGELGANAREFSRYLGKFIVDDSVDLRQGTATPTGGFLKVVTMSDLKSYGADLSDLPELNDYHGGDNKILQVMLGLVNKAKKELRPTPILVTRDLQLRVKCRVLGILSEDRKKSGLPSSVGKLYTGVRDITVPWNVTQAINEDRETPISLSSLMDVDEYSSLSPNEYITLRSPDGTPLQNIYRHVEGERFAKLTKTPNVYKLRPRNVEQKIALDMLMDPSIKLVSLIGKSGSGKAQPLSSKILTPTGWTTMGKIQVGDKVIGHAGQPINVIGVYPQGEKEIFEVSFSDGTKTRTCKEHLWETKTVQERAYKRKSKIRSTEEIMNSLHYGTSRKRNHSIPLVKPICFNKQDVLLDPYLVGVLLGDGGFSQDFVMLSSADKQIIDKCSKLLEVVDCSLTQKSKYDFIIRRSQRNNDQNDVVKALKELKLLGLKSDKKFVPNQYKFNSIDVRLKVLQGLMDTDGFVSKSGHSIIFYSTSNQLSNDVKEIVQSLGGKAIVCNKQTSYTHKLEKKSGLPSYAVHISMPKDIVPVTLERKVKRFKPRNKYQPMKLITSIESCGIEQAQCIMVDDDRHLYVTDDFVLTHNTLAALAAGLEQVLGQKKYKSLVVCRPIEPVGRDVGYLPGLLSEKMDPWTAPIKDNLKYLLSSSDNGDVYSKKNKIESEATLDQFIERGIIEIQAITFIRGRSISNAYIILDEAQNTSAHELKTIITRVGEGTKIVLVGDVEQVDNIRVDSMSNGLTVAVEKFRDSNITSHISLQKGERSELASLAATIL